MKVSKEGNLSSKTRTEMWKRCRRIDRCVKRSTQQRWQKMSRDWKTCDWKTTGVVSSIPTRSALPMHGCSCTHSLGTFFPCPYRSLTFEASPSSPGHHLYEECEISPLDHAARGFMQVPPSPGAEANWVDSVDSSMHSALQCVSLHLHWLNLTNTHFKRRSMINFRFSAPPSLARQPRLLVQQ